jgi:hypothetical protein
MTSPMASTGSWRPIPQPRKGRAFYRSKFVSLGLKQLHSVAPPLHQRKGPRDRGPKGCIDWSRLPGSNRPRWGAAWLAPPLHAAIAARSKLRLAGRHANHRSAPVKRVWRALRAVELEPLTGIEPTPPGRGLAGPAASRCDRCAFEAAACGPPCRSSFRSRQAGLEGPSGR